MKPQIKIYDRIFSHTYTMSNGYLKKEPDDFTWYRGDEKTEIAFYTDFSLSEVDANRKKHKYNIALLMESPGMFGGPYTQIKEIEDKFDYIFTFSEELLKRGDKYVHYYLGGTWIPEKDWAIYHKTRLVSMIASEKDVTWGQKLRHSIKARFGNLIDVYGKINNCPIKDKLTGLRNYRFSIVTENCDYPGYFTEKLVDCFLTGTIPIYYGSNTANKPFLRTGIMHFKDIDELKDLFQHGYFSASYVSNIDKVAKNFIYAKHYSMPENLIGDKLKTMGIL